MKLPLLPAFLRPRILVLDCGARHVACGLFTAEAGGRLVLRRMALESHSLNSGVDEGWAEATARALATLAGKEKFGGACTLVLPSQHTLVKFVRAQTIAQASRAGVIEFEARQNIPCSLDEVAWDHFVVADDGSDLQLMFAVVKRAIARAAHDAAKVAGFRVAQMTPSSFALLHAFRYNHPAERDSVLLVEIGARSTQLVFIEGPSFFIRTFPLGGDVLTQALAYAMDLDFPTAEALKIRILRGSADPATDLAAAVAVRRAAVDFAGRLHLEIVRSTIGYRRHTGAARPVTVYLTGGGALIPELPVLLADKLALRVVRFEPLRNVALLPSVRSGAEAVASRLVGLIGVAASLAKGGRLELNLLPPEVVNGRISRCRQAMLLAAAGLAVMSPLPVIWYYHRASAAFARTAASIERRLGPLRTLVARNSGNLARIEETRQRIELLRTPIAAKSNWILFLNDIQESLAQTEDVWLEKLQIARPPAGSSDPSPAIARRLILSGRLLDRGGAASGISDESSRRIKGLLKRLGQSSFIAAVEDEHFENAPLGILRFDFTLVLDPRRPL